MKKLKRELKKTTRPLILNLIILWLILLIIFTPFILQELTFTIIIFGLIFFVFCIYYGLWKMKKQWMWIVILILVFTIIFFLFFIFLVLSSGEEIKGLIYPSVIVLLNILSIFWLFTHKNLFI
jgi:hypothetical protein